MRKRSNLLPQEIPTQCYCWGSGVGGALGYDSKGLTRRSELKPVLCHRKNLISSCSSVISVSAGHQRSAFVTFDGECYSWGSGPLGRRTKSFASRCKPGKINICGKVVVKVAHGESHSAILTKNGTVLTFGDASNGKLGLGKKRRGVVVLPKSIPLLHGRKCINLACSHFSTMVILGEADEKSLMFGIMNGNRHGCRSRRNVEIPEPLRFPTKIVTISSGPSHCAAVCMEGGCYTWGLAENGRLGHGEEIEDNIVGTPKRIDNFHCQGILIGEVACGGAHTCMFSTDGQLFACGWNVYYQCGLAQSELCDILTPREILSQDQGRIITDISCGFAHSAAIYGGLLYTWGFNEEGQLGLGHERNIEKPTLVDFSEIDKYAEFVISVSCGHTHTLCLTSNHSKSQCLERQHEIDKFICAGEVLERFARYALFYTRARNNYHLIMTKASSTPDRDIVAVTEEPCLSPEEEDSITWNSDGSVSETSAKVDSNEVKTEENLSVSTVENILHNKILMKKSELLMMEREDKRSSQVSRFVNRLLCSQQKSRWIVIKETMRQWEVVNMTREDIFAKVRQDEERQVSHCRQREELRQRISTRNDRINDHIRKQANRLIAARAINHQTRKLKNKSARSKFKRLHGSNNTRSQHNVLRDMTRKSNKIPDSKNILSLSAMKVSHNKRNMILIRKRQARLMKQKQNDKEERKRQHLKMMIEQRKECEIIQQQKEDFEALKTKWILKNASKLSKLKKCLVEPKKCRHAPMCDVGDDDDSATGEFRSLSQWAKELS